MTDAGNAAQVPVVAAQLFEIWRAEQAQLGEKKRASWPAWLGVALALVGIVFSAGSLRSDVATAAVRIEKVEQRLGSQDKAIAQITDRLARIETKLDLVLEQRKIRQ
ncbi:hypothetical protein DAH66_12620 [Sphingomonas koreensis]|uniref:Uncharacterized protein n=1 Tax=Sphingomonas koreensis TaxID=93064 RepID=A0A430G2A8_9SPHN|nr:hypothetical protein [Sphingomonas koreensis]RSY83106.1 hypothetical protein DAH66_12620 [Sphingomonas koreensis]